MRSAFRVLISRTPTEAQLVVTRRCNLRCGYCLEADSGSREVPLATLKARIDELHRLSVVNIALLGGEPLLHPGISEVVAYARHNAQVSISTNGLLLDGRLIGELNDAGLSNLQVSIDALSPEPEGHLHKTLLPVLPQLELLRRFASFDTHVTLVLCGMSRPQFRATVERLSDLGFPVAVNVAHDGRGQVLIQGSEYADLLDDYYRHASPFSFIERQYLTGLLMGERPSWQCRAGARFLYVDESGLVRFCSAQEAPGVPVSEYGRAHLREHSASRKDCAEGCAVLCVYRNSALDNMPIRFLLCMAHNVRLGRAPAGFLGRLMPRR